MSDRVAARDPADSDAGADGLSDTVATSSDAEDPASAPTRPASPTGAAPPTADDSTSLFSALARVAHSPDLHSDEATGGAPLPRPGDIVGGHFEIIRLIGRGGMGAVFEARDRELWRKVALKVVLLEGDEEQRARLLDQFAREARAVATLRHDNIVAIHSRGVWQGPTGSLPFLVLELLSGESLADVIARGPLPPDDAIRLMIDVGRGLAHAHEAGVVHRDLKPANIFVGDDGRVRVLDFGLAAAPELPVGDARSTPRGTARTETITGGTPAYMAPECYFDPGRDPRIDVWAAGVVLYEMLTGRRPFSTVEAIVGAREAPKLTAADPQLPVGLDAVAAGALAPDPDDRFANASELVRALRGLRQGGIAVESAAPYRYLEAFTEGGAPWFFGREQEVRALRIKLRTHALVAVMGPSGAGKSSLVHAGLVPRLRAERPAWRVLSMAPGPRPLAALHRLLREEVGGAQAAGLDSPDTLRRAPGLVGEVLREHAQATGHPVVLVVDQLEELYTLGLDDPRAAAAFAEALCAAADDPRGSVRVVVTLRDDFFGRLARTPRLRDAITAGLGPALTAPGRGALTAALVEPARVMGYTFEDGIVDAVLGELEGDDTPLPLLQFAASHLWERRDDAKREIPQAPLSEAAGVSGLLARHADRLVAALDRNDRLIARQLLCLLVTADGTRRGIDPATLAARFPDDPEGANRVLGVLTNGRLVTASRDDARLAHESLVERWDTLRSWIEEERGHRRIRERLEQAAQHWDEEQRPVGLLWREHALDEALVWRDADTTALTATERAFLLEAEELRDREQAERARVRALERVGREFDASFGHRARYIVAIALIPLWMGHYAYTVIAGDTRWWMDFTATALVGPLTTALAIGAVAWWARRWIMATALNRGVVALLLAVPVSTAALGGGLILLDQPPLMLQVFTPLLSAMIATVGVFAIDRGIWPSAVACLIAFFVAAAFPHLVFVVLLCMNVFFLVNVIVLWRVRQRPTRAA